MCCTKNSIFRKHCAIRASAHACKWRGSRVEKFFHPLKMASKFFNSLPRNISSVHTFKNLDPHNEKVTIERRRGKLDKSILITTLTRNLSEFFLSCFLSLLPVWYGSMSRANDTRFNIVQLLLINKCSGPYVGVFVWSGGGGGQTPHTPHGGLPYTDRVSSWTFLFSPPPPTQKVASKTFKGDKTHCCFLS